MGDDGEYPISVEAEPDPSRWLWLVKWVLVIPHYVVLIPLWFSFVILTAIARSGPAHVSRAELVGRDEQPEGK